MQYSTSGIMSTLLLLLLPLFFFFDHIGQWSLSTFFTFQELDEWTNRHFMFTIGFPVQRSIPIALLIHKERY
jgi:hypothetical protein